MTSQVAQNLDYPNFFLNLDLPCLSPCYLVYMYFEFWLNIKLFYKVDFFLAWYPRVIAVMGHLLNQVGKGFINPNNPQNILIRCLSFIRCLLVGRKFYKIFWPCGHLAENRQKIFYVEIATSPSSYSFETQEGLFHNFGNKLQT